MDVIKNIYEAVKDTLSDIPTIAGNEDALAAQAALEQVDTLAETAVSEIETIAASEGIELKDYQLDLAKKALKIAAYDPKEVISKLNTAMKNPISAAQEADAVATLEGIPDYGEGETTVALEAFDSMGTHPTQHFNVVFTTFAAKQDEGAELLFPIIPVDPFSPGATVTATIISVYKDFLRDTTGKAVDRFKKVPLIKIANDPEQIDVDKNRLYPVVRNESKDVLVSELAHVVDNGDEEITTAPLKLGIDVDLLSVSQTDSMLAKGLMDPTDALDPNVKVTSIYYNLTGKDANGNDVTETFKFDIDALGVNYTYSTTAHNKDIILNAVIQATLNTATTLPVNKDSSAILSQLPQGYTVKLKLKLNGDGNTQEGRVALYVNGVELLEVKDPSGAVIPTTSDDYVSIKAVIDTFTAIGYDVEAYLINSNARVRGLLVTSDKYTAVFTVPFRTFISEQLPVVKNGNDGDIDVLNTSLISAYMKINASAYKTLERFISSLRNLPDDVDLKGISNKFVNKFFIEDTIDLTEVVDSLNSSTRIEDVRAAIINRLRLDVIRMYIESNYAVAFDSFFRGQKPTVTIVMDKELAGILRFGNTEFEDGVLNYKIASTINPLMRGKIVATFGVFDGNRNKQPNVLNFGQCFYAPDLVIPVVRSSNGRVANEITIMPRYIHTINIPLLVVYHVTNINTVLAKQPVYFKNV